VLTIGNFDGIHAGHRSILETVVRRAAALGGEAVVYTFEPHPRKVLQTGRAPGLLTTFEQKLELLEEAGVDVVIAEPFTLEFARTPSDAFVKDVIFGRIGPREVYVGYDFHFGRDREGSMRQLTEMGPRLGFAVTIIPEVTFGGADVNSTRIRSLLAEGSVEDAAKLLRRRYAVRGEVVLGDRRGRTLGFPTVNLALESSYGAVANVGLRPTFGGDTLQVEAFLFEFEADAYGRRVEIAFAARLRDERAFESVDALRTQIAADADRARRELGKP
jgi:riboflavin kinase/FMN adenylyltransferase